jgi:hypothetical protein
MIVRRFYFETVSERSEKIDWQPPFEFPSEQQHAASFHPEGVNLTPSKI